MTDSKSDRTSGKSVDLEPYYQQGGRYFLIDQESGEIVNVARLTAYSEYGEDVYGKDTHHEIPLLKIDAPRFLDVLSSEEHSRFHSLDPDPVDVDGFPILRIGL